MEAVSSPIVSTRERRASSAWVLNPGAEGNLPPAATGADYMLMWTRIFEGRGGLGEDFDFVYFVGPAAFVEYFSLDGNADMEKIDAYFDRRAASDPDLKKAIADNKITKTAFRNYYALRASVSTFRLPEDSAAALQDEREVAVG